MGSVRPIFITFLLRPSYQGREPFAIDSKVDAYVELMLYAMPSLVLAQKVYQLIIGVVVPGRE